MSHDKISRKSLKHDELIDALSGATDYVEGHRRQFLNWTVLGAGALVLAGAVWGFLVWRDGGLSRRLSEGLAILDAPVAAQGVAPVAGQKVYKDQAERKEAALAALRAVAKDAPSSTAGRTASLVVLGLETGTPSAATLDSVKGLTSQTSSLASGVAAASFLDATASAGKTAEAIAVARGWLEQPTSPLPKDIAAFTIARLYEKSGQKADARTYYQRVVSEFPESPMRYEAQQKLSQL